MDTAGKANKKSKRDETEALWVKVPTVAEELGLPLTRCYELIQRGDLPAVRIGERSIRVNRRELEEYLLNNCRVTPPTK